MTAGTSTSAPKERRVGASAALGRQAARSRGACCTSGEFEAKWRESPDGNAAALWSREKGGGLENMIFGIAFEGEPGVAFEQPDGGTRLRLSAPGDFGGEDHGAARPAHTGAKRADVPEPGPQPEPVPPG